MRRSVIKSRCEVLLIAAVILFSFPQSALCDDGDDSVQMAGSPEELAEEMCCPDNEASADLWQGTRLILNTAYRDDIETCGAVRAAYYKDRYLLAYDSEEAAKEAYEKLAAEYGDRVMPDIPVSVSAFPGWGIERMGMGGEHESMEGSPVTVAVLDTGIDADHPVFRGKTILPGYDIVNADDDPSDDNSHGTAVAGIIAAAAADSISILPVKTMNSSGKGYISDMILGIDYAVGQGADIINISTGAYCSASEAEMLGDMLAEAAGENAAVICAAGNDGADLDAEGVYAFPAESGRTICAASIDEGGSLSAFSNYGEAVCFAAPGEDIDAAVPGQAYMRMSGTSLAAPHVAAAAAAVWSLAPGAGREELISRLAEISEDLGEPGRDRYYGYGCPVFSEEAYSEPGNAETDTGPEDGDTEIASESENAEAAMPDRGITGTDTWQEGSAAETAGTAEAGPEEAPAEIPPEPLKDVFRSAVGPPSGVLAEWHGNDTGSDSAPSLRRMSVRGRTVSVRSRRIRRKACRIAAGKAFRIKGSGHRLVYRKLKGNRKISINRKTGQITIRKGLKRGTYRLTVRVSCLGGRHCRKESKKTVVKIIVK